MDNTDFEIEKGTSFVRTVAYLDENEDPIDITGYTAIMRLRAENNNTSTLYLTLETGSGITIADAAAGEFEVTITDEQTTLFPFTQAHYDMIVESPAGVKTKILKGVINVNPSISV